MSAPERAMVLRVSGLDCRAVSGLGCGSLIAPALAKIRDLAPDARTDHSGGLLRFSDSGQVEQVRAVLKELGYQSKALPDALVPDVARWYAPDELSREEAQVLAARVVPAFASDHPAAGTVFEALQGRLEAALFVRFTDRGLSGTSPRVERADAIAAATRDIVGADTAQALGRFVDRWLERGTSA